jgi:hypothetical protein
VDHPDRAIRRARVRARQQEEVQLTFAKVEEEDERSRCEKYLPTWLYVQILEICDMLSYLGVRIGPKIPSSEDESIFAQLEGPPNRNGEPPFVV